MFRNIFMCFFSNVGCIHTEAMFFIPNLNFSQRKTVTKLLVLICRIVDLYRTLKVLPFDDQFY